MSWVDLCNLVDLQLPRFPTATFVSFSFNLWAGRAVESKLWWARVQGLLVTIPHPVEFLFCREWTTASYTEQLHFQYFLTTQCILPKFGEYCPLCTKPACCVDSLMMPSQHMLCTSLMRFYSPQVMNFTITSSHHMSTPHPLLQFLTQPSLKWACLQCGSHYIRKDSWRYGVVSLQLY